MTDPSEMQDDAIGIADADRAVASAKAEAANPINKARFMKRSPPGTPVIRGCKKKLCEPRRFPRLKIILLREAKSGCDRANESV